MRSALLSTLVLISASACSEDAAPLEVETPARQFIFEGVRIEQREAGELVWVAEARRSDGDLSSSDAQDIHMVHKGDLGRDYDITSPRGVLEFDAGKATFAEVRVREPGGGVLTAGQARYDDREARLYVDGPLDFAAPGLTVKAPRGEFHLDTEEIHVDGPVIGRFDPAKRP
jgi:hypothetical protein